MKQIRRRIPSPLYSFPLLAFILILIFAASYLLAGVGLPGLFSASLFNTPKGVLLLVVGPLAIIVFLALFFLGIVSDSLRHDRPSKLSRRLFASFCFIAICASFPQTVIVGRFVSTALGAWFTNSISASLQASIDIAELYTDERVRIIEAVADRYLNGLSISNYRARPVDWMTAIRAMDPYAAACQVYLEDGVNGLGEPIYSPVIETGDSTRFVPRSLLGIIRDGLFTLDADEGAFRYGQTVRYANKTYICAYTSGLPEGFEARLDSVRGAWNQARIVDTLKPYLPFMSVWIYMMFIFPSVLMVIVISYYLSSRLADPVRALEESVARIAEGDYSFRVIPHQHDGFADSARLINSIAESIVTKTKPDKKAVLRL